MKHQIYLDNNATTELAEEVIQVILEDMNSGPANPSSSHFLGREAKLKLLKARESVAAFFQLHPQEVYFTSSGTESMNLLLKGCINPDESPHILTSNIEHSCVEKSLYDLQKMGCSVSFLPAGQKGYISKEQLEEAIEPKTRYLVFSAASSETGVKNDLKAFGCIAKMYDLPLFVDGTAQLGKEPLEIDDGISGMGFSAHKFHGPKGVGLLTLRRSFNNPLRPLFSGGGQEYGLRSGTENLSGILGAVEALRLVSQHMPQAASRMKALRDLFEETLISAHPWISVNGTGDRLSNVSNLRFNGIDAETLLIQLDLHGIAASLGSACSSGLREPSKVLLGMGLTQNEARSSIRFSLSRYTTEEDIKIASGVIIELCSALM